MSAKNGVASHAKTCEVVDVKVIHGTATLLFFCTPAAFCATN